MKVGVTLNGAAVMDDVEPNLLGAEWLRDRPPHRHAHRLRHEPVRCLQVDAKAPRECRGDRSGDANRRRPIEYAGVSNGRSHRLATPLGLHPCPTGSALAPRK